MAEDPQPMTLQQRIASLNAAHIGRIPGEPPLPRPKPQIPLKRPVVVQRQKTINNPPERVNGSITDSSVGNRPLGTRQNGLLPPPPTAHSSIPSPTPKNAGPPPLPKRQPSGPLPALPSRRPSEQRSRRESVESHSSTTSGVSSYSNGATLSTITRTKSSDSAIARVKAPAWGDCELPPLPTRGAGSSQRKYSSEKPKYEIRAPSSTRVSPSRSPADEDASTPTTRPSLPPRLPPRRPKPEQQTEASPPESDENEHPQTPFLPLPAAATIEKIKPSALSFGLNKEELTRPTENGLQAEFGSALPQPPPIPLASRPDISTLVDTKARSGDTETSPAHHSSDRKASCLICRDFSAPDHYSSLFPRSQVTSLQQLAQQLTSPFPSETDKARVIFSWLHHNIRYDVDSFFANNVKGSTPQSTLQSGLAVCEGYAALFTNLATYAGLESVVISGHGKGFGYTPLLPGAPLPPYNAGHAWNAVRIDDGEWKLIDACWGAGHVQGKGQPYVQQFHERYFTMENEEFGIKHFPGNKDMFYLPGGRRMGWEEYIQINPAAWPLSVEPPTLFSSSSDYGIGERTVLPRSRQISLRQGGVVRFQFSLHCPHWTVEGHSKKGPPPVFMVATHGVDGRNKEYVPLEHVRGQNSGGGGDFWYCDINARDLGAAGQTVTLFAVSSFGDRQDARGLTVREFKEGKGRVGMGFQGVAAWDLV